MEKTMTAKAYEKIKEEALELARGVHRLSKESIEILARAAAKAEAIAEKHIKRLP
jgi:predicted translin family RNA/ssDNA-binding protein